MKKTNDFFVSEVRGVEITRMGSQFNEPEIAVDDGWHSLTKEYRMKTVTFSAGTAIGEQALGFCSQAPIALAILQRLSCTSRRKGLTAEELINDLAAIGVLFPAQNERNAISTLLNRLQAAQLVCHPDICGGTRRYIRTSLPVSLII